MDNLVIRLIENQKEMNDVFEVRRVVFVEGQNVPKKCDLDGLDDTAKHVIVLLNNQPIGCARIRFLESNAKFERIAILEKYQGMGFGIKLMNFLIEYIKKEGFKKITIHSQYYIKDFYTKCGFKEKGKKFIDVGIAHIEMELFL